MNQTTRSESCIADLKDGAQVRILVGDKWYRGELQLRWRSPCVWTPELGHVDLENGPCPVDAIEPLEMEAAR